MISKLRVKCLGICSLTAYFGKNYAHSVGWAINGIRFNAIRVWMLPMKCKSDAAVYDPLGALIRLLQSQIIEIDKRKTKMTKLSMHWHNSDKLFVYPKMHRIFCADFCRLLISLIAQTHGRHPIASKRNRQLQTVKTNKIIRKKTFSIREQFVYLLWCCLPNSTSEAIGMEHMKMPVHNQWHFIDGHYPTFHLSQCS